MQSAYKPGSVSPPQRGMMSVIYLVLPSPISSSGLPPGIGRATLPNAPVYMTLQPIRRTAPPVTKRSVSSYLAFSPLPDESGGHSLLRCSTLADAFPLGSMALCVARTFLTSPRNERQTSRLQSHKCRSFSWIIKISTSIRLASPLHGWICPHPYVKKVLCITKYC